MNLTKLALKRPVSCFLVLLALAVFGISSIFGFKMELTPDIEMPMLIVMATYPGADPESVDELVASVIEDSGSTLSGVDSVNSYSFENYCMVLFTYEYGVDIDECHNDLRAAMETAKLSLPDDVDQPTIIEMNMNSMDVMTISAVEVGDVDLLKVVNESVVPELESLSSVAQVSVTGGSEDYIKVELNETLMKQYGLTMSSVAQMLGTVDFTYPAGSVTQGSQDISVATSMEYNTVQKLREVPLMTTKGQVITLQDIANVTTASKDASSISTEHRCKNPRGTPRFADNRRQHRDGGSGERPYQGRRKHRQSRRRTGQYLHHACGCRRRRTSDNRRNGLRRGRPQTGRMRDCRRRNQVQRRHSKGTCGRRRLRNAGQFTGRLQGSPGRGSDLPRTPI